jgi:putative membrane protein (TIGR04086 family)
MEDDGMRRRGKAVELLKSIVVSYVLTALALLVLALIRYQMKWSAANGGILVVYVLSCLVGGWLFSRSFATKRYLGGGVLGAAYFLVVYVVSAVWNHSLAGELPGMLTAFLICFFSGMLGGMLRSGMKN